MAGQGSRCSNDAVSVARDSARKFRLNFGRISKTFPLSLSFFIALPRAHDETTEGGTVYNRVVREEKVEEKERERKREGRRSGKQPSRARLPAF